MLGPPLTLRSFPRAILHIDGDAFFASCEQSRAPELRGRPVVTGKERGIAASMGYDNETYIFGPQCQGEALAQI